MEKYAVITGASSGIGEEFARQLSQLNYHLILVARRKERLEKLAKELHSPCDIIIADLSKEKECYQLFEQIKNKHISIFVNNAGFGDFGYFIKTDLQKEINMIDVNIKALHILQKLALQHMETYDDGYILNVASSAGLLPAGPYMSTYYATKSYVTSLTRGVNEELKQKHSHIYIGCLCPGPVDTEFNSHAQVQFALKGISAQKCVQYALKKMKQRKVVIVPTIKMKLAVGLGHFLPSPLLIRIIAFQQKRKAKT